MQEFSVLKIVPVDPDSLGGKDWLWLDFPDGNHSLLVANARETELSSQVASAVATTSFLRGCVKLSA